jgi:hypothetical protein
MEQNLLGLHLIGLLHAMAFHCSPKNQFLVLSSQFSVLRLVQPAFLICENIQLIKKN